ncbi:putative arsenite transmembrane transporter protein [Coniella lustricola]|uniref:Putative arsenite transmembrane transporter protein n=1 Tax=Coniella lustricola TaxID=2025994 RepID=A0A2T3A721_9PEZI|nr:putative arsenite transmembrane transporter protein [Coniella lustricola]
MSNSSTSLDVNDIRSWRSIVTLIVFVLTNLVVLFPFHVPIYVPAPIVRGVAATLRRFRVIPARKIAITDSQGGRTAASQDGKARKTAFIKMRFPMNFITAPLIADLFLLAILAIGRQEVYDGTVGSNDILPIDIMVFFLTLAYIAISIDASGLIRYLAFRVLTWGGEVGHRLFFYLYAFFFALGSFIGNDPIILSGTAFLAYMTRVSSNIEHPRAWIHTQFAVANVASAILVTSNPTNLVLAGAFNVKFIDYTANMVVPVVITALLLFPCLLYFVFAHERLIPLKITMHELPEGIKDKKPINPNIPNARGNAEEVDSVDANGEQQQLLSLEEIMNPFVDKWEAIVGAVIMTATLITVLVVNAASQTSGERPAYWITLPAAFVMFCWDVGSGWVHRHETRTIARRGRAEIETARAERLLREHEAREEASSSQEKHGGITDDTKEGDAPLTTVNDRSREDTSASRSEEDIVERGKDIELNHMHASKDSHHLEKPTENRNCGILGSQSEALEQDAKHDSTDVEQARRRELQRILQAKREEPRTLVSITEDCYLWCQETFPTVSAVLAHLPFALVPFALCMFVLVEALVTKGWVPVFAYGWDHWVNKTGTIGAIGGMAFLSVILCNFAGTNIGTTILLSRVIQAWEQIHRNNNTIITDRDFWATVYAMALGVNYGAFSTAFSASLAGLLWRDILARKHIHVRRLEFARVNLPIIVIAMVIGCTTLVGEVYIYRHDDRPYSTS